MNQAQTALIIVDMQNDFMPNGALAVQNADQIIQPINQLAQHFQNVILTQDWHPNEHISFVDNHTNQQVFDYIELSYGQQVLWPRHCVQGSQGAEFHRDLNIPHTQLIIRKGYHVEIDSYSAFLEADKKTATGLASYLRERQINTVYIVGVATDYCVKWTALDAQQAGFKTYVIEDMCKAIDINGSLAQAWLEMSQAGVQRVQSCQMAF
ncbi:bifunctional nicotinamidase/pyrazinamidase [Moraxella sp. ZY210820]|uniref:bifunctional nicotinamidase/pyrazinamidase n=1 Tax=unclassified Moraxella TaxID=2685852 RepID=UPI0027318E59|nr:bifunctional nicotinamidase/pyrazinamidase [Moraxella sp. ZY210820]WLF83026.1 bifunctional nicotinamidase/pyrazinamidase [Moraxella sp. ZY210820]